MIDIIINALLVVASLYVLWQSVVNARAIRMFTDGTYPLNAYPAVYHTMSEQERESLKERVSQDLARRQAILGTVALILIVALIWGLLG